MDTQSILKMIGAIGGAVGSIGGSFGGAGSATSLTPAQGPSLDELTLNPQVMGGNPPQVPYDFGQGPDSIPTGPTPPMAPPEGTPGVQGTDAKGKPITTEDAIAGLGKAISSMSKFSKDMQNSPMAAQMFQEAQHAQIAQNEAKANQIEKFRRHDLSSQILEQYGLL